MHASALRLSRDHIKWERLRRGPNFCPTLRLAEIPTPGARFRPANTSTPQSAPSFPSLLPWMPRHGKAYLPVHKVSSGFVHWCFVHWCLNSQKFITGPVQTESGGNVKSGINSGTHFPVPTAPQQLDVFAENSGTFDCARYMVPISPTDPVHPSESTQGLHVRRHAFMYGPREE